MQAPRCTSARSFSAIPIWVVEKVVSVFPRENVKTTARFSTVDPAYAVVQFLSVARQFAAFWRHGASKLSSIRVHPNAVAASPFKHLKAYERTRSRHKL